MKYIPQLEESEPGLEEQSIVLGVNATWDLVALMSPCAHAAKQEVQLNNFPFIYFFFPLFG